MRVVLDTCDPMTVYADLRDEESLTDELRERAVARARQLHAEHVEFWRSPYGDGADRMAGFIERARVPAESEAGSGAANARADEGVTEASTQQLCRAI